LPTAVELTQPRYDQSTYLGRVKHFLDVTDPRTLFVSSAGLEEAKRLIADHAAGRLPPHVAADAPRLWHAKKVVDSTLHPDTGEPIFLPFRMSCFVPVNMIVVAGLLLPNPSTASIMFWQWANQSLNVAINYSNANKTTPMSFRETATAYLAAVTASCGIAVGLNRTVPRLSVFSPAMPP